MRISRWVAGLFCCALLVACTPATDDPGTGGTDPTPRGGKIEIGIVGEPSTLDPYGETASDLTYALARPVFPMPYRLLPDGTIEPDLAESLEATPTGARLVIENRRWSSERRIKAKDVVASIRRATPPSGFARIRKARVLGPRTIELTGNVGDWESTLATGAFVLPGGRMVGGNVSGGPFRFSAYERGRRITYEANPTAPAAPLLDELEVSFVRGTDLLIRLLEQGDVDVAWLPTTVNLSDRLEELGLPHASASGSEEVVVRFNRDRIRADQARALVGAAGVKALGAAFIRDEGEVIALPEGRKAALPSLVSLAAPEGDELLTLMQRAIQLALERSDVTVELITGPVSTVYGRWQRSAPADLLLHRSMMSGPKSTIPIASVATFVAWRDGVHGITVNPTLDGPLWDASRWWREP